MIFDLSPTLSKACLDFSEAERVNRPGAWTCLLIVIFCVCLFNSETYSQVINSDTVTVSNQPYLTTHSSISGLPDSLTFGKHIFSKNFRIAKQDFSIAIDPLIQASGGIDLAEKQNSVDILGGIRTEIRVSKLAFAISAAKGFAALSGYQKEYVQDHEVIPGMGYAHPYKDNYNYNYVASNFWYAPSKRFYIQLGYDKNFIGDGYRSLLLSDNASNYPFLKLSTTVWKFRYINIWAQFNSIFDSNGDRDLFQKKYGAFHYLSWDIHKRFSIGLFETIVWQTGDSVGARGFEINYLNPFVFYRPVEFSVGSPDNALLGLNTKLRLWKKTVLYGQIMLDEFFLTHIRSMDGWWANKQAAQLGCKVYDLFGIKNLYVQTEANYVRPFTYSHYKTNQNYGHYNQPLAHILSSNFIESVNFIKYHYRKFYFDYELMAALKGENIDSLNYGANLYDSYTTRFNELGNYTGQGLKTYIFYNSLKLSYLLNQTNSMGFFIQVTDRRKYSSLADEHSMLFMAGIQICPVKRYWDF